MGGRKCWIERQLIAILNRMDGEGLDSISTETERGEGFNQLIIYICENSKQGRSQFKGSELLGTSMDI